MHRAALVSRPRADRLAAMNTWRRDRGIGVIHVCDAKRVDGAKRVQDMPVKFDPMSSDGICERIGKPYPIGSLIERDEIMRLQFAQNPPRLGRIPDASAISLPKAPGRKRHKVARQFAKRCPQLLPAYGTIGPAIPRALQFDHGGPARRHARRDRPIRTEDTRPDFDRGLARQRRFQFQRSLLRPLPLASATGKLLHIPVECLCCELQSFDSREIWEDHL